MVGQREQLGRKWYVALTKSRHEETAHFYLKSRGIEVFHPKLVLPTPNNSGRQVLSLFPSYIFVAIDASSSDYFQVAWCPGIRKLVGFGGEPSPIEAGIVNFLREQADRKGLIVARSNLKAGDEIQIISGPLKGLAGIIQAPPDSKTRVRMLMRIMSRQVNVLVSASDINGGWVGLPSANS